MKFKLSAPKFLTWLIALILGIAGILIHFNILNLGALNTYGVLFLIASTVLLLLGTLLKAL